jgi:hypothetical protein
MSSNEQEKYLKAIGAALIDAEQGTAHGLYAYEDIDGFVGQDAQGLFGMTWDDVKARGNEFWDKISPKLYALFCDSESDDHTALAELIQEGSPTVAAAVAGIIVPYILGFVPAIAAGTVAYFLAKFVLTSFFTSGYELACEKWKEKLPKEEDD